MEEDVAAEHFRIKSRIHSPSSINHPINLNELYKAKSTGLQNVFSNAVHCYNYCDVTQ